MVLEIFVGEVNDYDPQLGAAVIDLEMALHEGDRIHIVGDTTNMEGTVESMRLECQKVDTARSGDQVSITVDVRVDQGDQVYRIIAASASVAGAPPLEMVASG